MVFCSGHICIFLLRLSAYSSHKVNSLSADPAQSAIIQMMGTKYWECNI